MTENALIPEFAVRDYPSSKQFYIDCLGFNVAYERPHEGFGFFERDGAQLMLDQVGLGRTFDDGHLPSKPPFGKGVNLQIRITGLDDVLMRLYTANHPLYLKPEQAEYLVKGVIHKQRQFVVADPDGYLLRFWEPVM